VLAQIITAENGKPIAEARGEVDYSAAFYAESARRMSCLEPRVLEQQPKGHQWTVYARPAGVAGLIVPWNFPLAMLAKKAAAALAAGCPIVVKPAEKTPLSSIALFHIFHELGMPAGMVNLVFGDAPAIGKVLCEHPAVRVISFTGSTAVGKLLAAQAAPYVKRMALELGGNAPFIVFDDADLEHAANELITNKFRCSGQTCVCSNRVYVQAGVAADFAKLVAARVGALEVGPGVNPGSQVGPLIDAAGFGKVRELVEDALARGATAITGGAAPVPADGTGLFYPPTVLDGVTGQARCLKEELFGPVVPLVRFATEQELVQAANDTEYGLAAYVFTKDMDRAGRVIAQLRFGHVGLNSGTGPSPEAPFGGMKQSGLGREGGDEGILEYVELQTVPTPLGR
jgi:succinate-semialdehyde dehydrogenase / glutarate-semialdehyde dehydrogenase